MTDACIIDQIRSSLHLLKRSDLSLKVRYVKTDLLKVSVFIGIFITVNCRFLYFTIGTSSNVKIAFALEYGHGE